VIVTQYRVTTKCDSCNKTLVTESIDYPPVNMVPIDWIQTQPPGSRTTREFCSVKCLDAWQEIVRPWDTEPDVVEGATARQKGGK
jgi:hypothetical protein